MLGKFKEDLFSLIERDCSANSDSNPKILAAVSGGVDSMTMASLLYECYFPDFAIATVNFKLRSQESDADEELVRKWAQNRKIKYFTHSFETETYARNEKISVEMAARDLRYNWFYYIMEREGYEYLAVAHNLNDSVETLFLNLLRGTGIDGLSGIRKKTGKIVRPLLKFDRKEIMEYAIKERVSFRVDKTNLESFYTRNRIRNRVFPEFGAINPSFLHTIERDMEYFTAAGEIIREQYEMKRDKLIERSEGKICARINISAVKAETNSRFWLYMLLNEYGVNSSQAEQIYESLEGQPGKEFHTVSHLLIKDREYLLIYTKGNSKDAYGDPFLNRITIRIPDNFGFFVNFRGVEIRFRQYPKDKYFEPTPSKKKFYIDADKVKFPLVCRLWEEGDRFIPLGMTGYKKLSDFYTDAKLDIKSKDNETVLISEEDIICLLGHRIDDRYKITTSTTNILEVEVG